MQASVSLLPLFTFYVQTTYILTRFISVVLPPGLSKDSYEIQFAVNHIAHAQITKLLLPALQKAASRPASDVRIITTTSLGFRFASASGIPYDALQTTQDSYMMGPWVRYGRSKYANVLHAYQLAKLYPNITSVSIHPGVTGTDLIANSRWRDRLLIYVTNLGGTYFTAEEGALNQLWLAAGVDKAKVKNGTLYLPVGVDGSDLVAEIKDLDAKAKELWDWTEEALAKVE